jgi:predicted nucleic acid-binding protein
MPAMTEHVAVRAFLLNQLQNSSSTLVLTPSVLHEFIHIVTDSRRFDPPVSMPEAIAIARLYLGRRNIECIVTDESAVLEAFALLEKHNLGRKRIADTLLVATLLGNDVRELVTCDLDNFRVFERLTLVDPRAEALLAP